jgi:hypothetical protein
LHSWLGDAEDKAVLHQNDLPFVTSHYLVLCGGIQPEIRQTPYSDTQRTPSWPHQKAITFQPCFSSFKLRQFVMIQSLAEIALLIGWQCGDLHLDVFLCDIFCVS